MRFLLAILLLSSSSYFVEWIPNNAAASPAPSTSASAPRPAPGEWPWQG